MAHVGDGEVAINNPTPFVGDYAIASFLDTIGWVSRRRFSVDYFRMKSRSF
jgi:hypothetical protein